MNLETSRVEASLDAIHGVLAQIRLSMSTLNFVVWIDDPGRRAWVLERAALLTHKHPSMMLLLDNTGAESGGTRSAIVTTGCREDNEHGTVRGERVDLDVSGLDAATISRFVTSLCTPNVPTVLWWTGLRESSRATFEALLPLSSMFIVDSSGATGDDTALRALVAFHRERPWVVLRDLAWLRLRPWQDMIANFFDDPALREELYTLRSIRVASGSASEALYLGGWLASSLGWTATARDTFADARGKQISFSQAREGEIRRVRSVCLDSDTSWYHGEVTDDPEVVKIWVEGEHARQQRYFPLRLIDTASLIEAAILEEGPDELFEVALTAAGTLLG